MLPVVLEDPLDHTALTRMKTWLEHCDNSHNRCAYLHERKFQLPTRLLDLRSLPGYTQMIHQGRNWSTLFANRHCKLIETTLNQHDRYATLSYCWGDSLVYTTTSKNIEAHKLGIEVERLPGTLRDAIRVARYFDIPYIWIDCLCIVQDSRADWAQESGRMATVYSCSYLNIAASRASHVGNGFLGLRDVPLKHEVSINDNEGTFELYFVGPHKVSQRYQ